MQKDSIYQGEIMTTQVSAQAFNEGKLHPESIVPRSVDSIPPGSEDSSDSENSSDKER